MPHITDLLTFHGLPLDGLEQTELWALEGERGEVMGCAGLETHGAFGLLRSVAVSPEYASRGLGKVLVAFVIVQARERRLHSLSLLTTTASDYFAQFGFHSVARADLPSPLGASAELRGACPSTATAMTLELSPSKERL